MKYYSEALNVYRRLPTREVKIGDLLLGNGHPIRVQTMTTTDTMDTLATVEQTIRCIEAGAEMVRITAPSKNEAENLAFIKEELHKRGYTTPLVADIHFTPNAAEIAARIVEKVRVNPGNYVDKKKFEQIDYTDAEYREEIERIRERFTPLVLICKQHGTAMRIGTNHGSLSDRIMSRYGDTAKGMVESAMEFLRIARSLDYHNIVLSMKSSNPLVMVQAYRLLVQQMMEEFGECYPLHLGVTEAGDGEDGRIKSAIGIGSLLEDGIGDTIRVSLTEDPEFEIPVCNDIVKRYAEMPVDAGIPEDVRLAYSPFDYKRRETRQVKNIGAKNVPVVVADYMSAEEILPGDLVHIGYRYDAVTDKWSIGDAAADLIYSGTNTVSFELPGTLRIMCDHKHWLTHKKFGHYPLYQGSDFLNAGEKSDELNFVAVEAEELSEDMVIAANVDPTVVFCIYSNAKNGLQRIRLAVNRLMRASVNIPVILAVESHSKTIDEQLIDFSVQAGGLFLDGIGDGIWLMNNPAKMENKQVSGRTYLQASNNHAFLNNTSFSILQAVRTRISKTEYISCPSCGRTLFDLQETTTRIRSVTHHLKGLKIAIMGCIVNGPGEMADADFGYVGSGPGKITLYKGKEVVKRNIQSEVAVDELINLLKENNVWIDPQHVQA
ncbi:MAG: 4-hydroxy-3-methylbut-2-en-1-yl diphosphate synthase [Chitinophagaceae bacterium]|nr:MAG: 4-hydroxy-3-methylbut-2-en-1-yl diphosphate synthase [Chitinophagaceae bacterium]